MAQLEMVETVANSDDDEEWWLKQLEMVTIGNVLSCRHSSYIGLRLLIE